MRSCLLCGSTDELTEHHLLPKGTWRRQQVERRKVIVCWPCHQLFHLGPIEQRRATWERLWHLIPEEDRRHVLKYRHPGTVFASLLPDWIVEGEGPWQDTGTADQTNTSNA